MIRVIINFLLGERESHHRKLILHTQHFNDGEPDVFLLIGVAAEASSLSAKTLRGLTSPLLLGILCLVVAAENTTSNNVSVCFV